MNLYTTNNLNNTTAMLFNGVGNEYYNYNFGGCGCGGFNIGNWLNGTLMGNMGGFNYGCGCGTGNADWGYAMFSGLLNGLMLAGTGMITGSRANKAAQKAEDRALRQNFDKALKTLRINDKSDTELAKMTEGQIDDIKIEDDYNDTTKTSVKSQIDELKDTTIPGCKTKVSTAEKEYNDAKKAWQNETDATKKAAFYQTYLQKESLWKDAQAELKAAEDKLEELEKQLKTIEEKQTAFRDAKKTVKDYIAKTLKPAQEAEDKVEKDKKGKAGKPQTVAKPANTASVTQTDYANIIGSDRNTTLQNLIDAYNAIKKTDENTVDENDSENINAFINLAKQFSPVQLHQINDVNIKKFINEKRGQIFGST